MIIIFKMSRAPKKISNIKCNYCPDTGGPKELLVALDDLIHIRNKHIIGWGHTDQMRKLSAANSSGRSSDFTGAHCAQQDLTGAHCV